MIYDNSLIPSTNVAGNPIAWLALLVTSLVSVVVLLFIRKNKSNYVIEKRI